MRSVTSIKNPVIQEARSLQSARGRKDAGAFLLDGEHMVSEALKVCPGRVRRLFVDEACLEQYACWLELAPADADVVTVPAHVLEAVSQVKTPQGILAVCAFPGADAQRMPGSRLILLENVQDPGNVGTVLRTVDAAGFDGCIMTAGCADPYGPKTIRASMGSLFRVPIIMAESAADTGRELASRGYAVIGAELHGSPFYEREPLPEKVCVMIGNEGQGLTPEALEACTHRFKLPMRGGAESLNAAVAAAIFMYDIVNR